MEFGKCLGVKTNQNVDWPKRLRNLRIIMAERGMTTGDVSRAGSLGANTVTNILSGKSTPRTDTLELICHILGVHNIAVLDSDNPISEVRNELFRVVENLTDDQARQILDLAQQMSDAES